MEATMKFNEQELELLNLVLDREIKENEDYVETLHGDEFDAWNDELNDLKKLKQKLKIEKNLVIQKLVDDMIDNQIDDLIAQRHGGEI
jgi:alcohol dehydrogenase class IV